MFNMRTELQAAGCDFTADEFRKIVQQMKDAMFPDDSEEEIVCNTETYAAAFISAVRQRCKCPDLPDWIITKTLINFHK